MTIEDYKNMIDEYERQRRRTMIVAWTMLGIMVVVFVTFAVWAVKH